MNYAVISTNAALRASVAEALLDGRLGVRLAASLSAPFATLGREVADDLRRESVQVVVLDLSDDSPLGLRFARFLSEEIPGVTFVMVGPADVPPALLLEAMRVGASEYVKTPHEYAELAAALGRAARRIGAVPTPESREPGRVYAFYAAKGGTGVTTAAVNFAVWLRHASQKSTLLVDLDLELGGSANLLGLTARYTLSDFVRNLHRMDLNLLESLVTHHQSGLDVLASPMQPTGGEVFTNEQVRSAMHYLRRNYENVVIDLARAINPVTLAALERSDELVLLTTPELPSLRNTKKVLPFVQRAVPGGKANIHVVVNRTHKDDLIQNADVQKVLGLDVYWTLARDDAAVSISANEGRPAVERDKSKYARDMQGLVGQLAGATNGKSSGWGGRLWPFRRTAKE